MFNVDQSADYLGGYMGNPLDSQEPKRKQVSPPSSAIPYKSEAQGQKDLIMKHQKFLLDHIRNAQINKEIADLYKNFLVSRLKIVFLVEDKDGFLQNGKNEDNQRIIQQIDAEIKKQQHISNSLQHKFDSLFPKKQLMAKNEHIKIGEMMFMVDQPVDHNKIEGFIRLVPSLNKFHTSGQKINDLETLALNQLNESRSTHLPPEAKNDLRSAMRQTQETQYVRQQQQLPPPQSHLRKPQRQRMQQQHLQQQPLPQESIEPEAVAFFEEQIKGESVAKPDATKMFIGIGLVSVFGYALYKNISSVEE